MLIPPISEGLGPVRQILQSAMQSLEFLVQIPLALPFHGN